MSTLGHHPGDASYQKVMGTVLLTRVYRRLFSHHTCSRLQSHPPLRTHSTRYSGDPKQGNKDAGLNIQWQQKPDMVSPDRLKEFASFPVVTADALRSRRKRPRQVKMLMRDFIEGKASHSNPLTKFANQLR